MASIHFRQISHRRPGDFDALAGFELDIADGEVVVFAGGPGSGASTALRLLAGFEDPDHGTIRIGDQPVAGFAPRDRRVALVLPHHSLYPDQTTADHLRFPLVVGGEPEATRERRIGDVADRLGLGALLDRRPAELTLAEQQRVAIGRAIVRRPEVLLMDTPCSGLSGDARDEARHEIARCCDVLAMTTIVVSDDAGDAQTIGRRIVRFERAGTAAHTPA